MSNSALERNCPDCGEILSAIRIVTVPVSAVLGGAQQELGYSVHEKRSFWTGQFPIDGKVESLLCPACGRVFFFARAE
jgi:predicted RNA-binding Zn-ribbon protein involved in translation (DUF1610 family)